MQFDDIKQQASIDLARFIAPNHFHFREHTPAAYKEIAEPLLQQRLGLTNRELCAVKALALWASFEEIERAAFASLVSNVGEPPKTIPEHELMRIDALRHNVCLAAHDYARQVGDPLLIEAWPKPVWMAETQPEAEPEQPADAADAPAVGRPVRWPEAPATGPIFTMTKAGMVSQHKHEWPTIESDMKDATRNGLATAKAGTRNWQEATAMEWARAKGKLTSVDRPGNAQAGANNPFNLPSRTHTLKS